MSLGFGSIFGADLAADVFGAELGYRDAEDRQRDAFNHQIYMRNTAYQASVEDMRAAGLNPILAASRGATPAPSAPAGGGGAATHGRSFSGAYSAYQQGEVQKSQDMLLRSEIELRGEQSTATAKQGNLAKAQADVATIQALRDAQTLPDDIRKRAVEVLLTEAQVGQAKAVTGSQTASAAEAVQRTKNLVVDMQSMEERLKALRTEGKIDETMFGEVMRILNRGIQSMRGSVPVPGR